MKDLTEDSIKGLFKEEHAIHALPIAIHAQELGRYSFSSPVIKNGQRCEGNIDLIGDIARGMRSLGFDVKFYYFDKLSNKESSSDLEEAIKNMHSGGFGIEMITVAIRRNGE